MAISLNTILLAGLIMAFVLPALAIVALTLPTPIIIVNNSNTTINETQVFNATGARILNQFSATFNSLGVGLIGNCNPSISATMSNTVVPTCSPNNSSFFANPTIFTAYSFIVNGLGNIMTNVVQLPYLDYLSMNFLMLGVSNVFPGSLGFISIGVDLLYMYMILTILLQGVSLIMKYNIMAASSSG